MQKFKNGNSARVKRLAKGHYRGIDVNWWKNKAASGLWDKTVTKSVNKWKWVRL